MKRLTFPIMALILSLVSVGVNATTMTIETRGINSVINNTDFVASWNNQTSSITTSSLSAFNFYSSGINSISRLSVDFTTGVNSSWGFEAGLDAGYGAAFYLDGTLLGGTTDDLWWGYNWNNSNEVLSVLDNNITAGSHTLELYWAENCCNGASSVRFTSDGTNWEALSVANVDTTTPTPVPEPAAIWLLALGLVGLAVNKRNQNKNC